MRVSVMRHLEVAVMRQKIYSLIKGARNVALLPHKDIDGDALASCLALKSFIEQTGGEARILAEGEIPSNLLFLGGGYDLIEQCGEIPDFDVAVALDCGSRDRLGDREHIFINAGVKIVIDHHATNKGFGDYFVVSPESSATCELIYEFFEKFGVKLTKEAADFLYTGIVTDTGGFRYSNTTQKTLETAAKLLKSGADSEKICMNIFETKRLSQLRIEGAAIEGARFFHGGKTVVSYISQEIIDSCGANESDTSGISSVLKSIDGVSAAVSLKDSEGRIRVSMRSDDKVDSAAVCASLGGGGHIRAAGATLYVSAEEAEEKIVSLIGEFYERDNQRI